MKHITIPLKKLFDFSGKSTRKEFWLFYLFLFLMSTISMVILKLLKIPEDISSKIQLYLGVFFILAIGFRRMNDIGLNKFLFLIPVVNLILACFPTDYFSSEKK
ncbi:DUF805 domain-containing protein [Capnocytophaga sp. ARDL2]|uniref:DUF805 domain-containing protein n=1 Tax=Capnocytophaga sp. ARDL2 TaxID=3238809 RepID=UPI003555CBAC